MAKQLLLETRVLTTPKYHPDVVLYAVGRYSFEDEVRIPSKLLHFDSAEAEVTVEHLRPDLALYLPQGQILLVEIRVTHAVTAEKAAWAAKTNRAMQEIDLSDLSDDDLLDKAHFSHRLFHDTANKQWIHNPKGAQKAAEKLLR
ncbi:hypothetical protein [Chitinilyticum piscinae]|uniref:Uncharacterized protein n=1 Tax=Chitinilyticum piscinae TaxID=2866724 RepID=A0A8J7K381_9NEIS|nr:hypothetical protein [Chitinilyticum piscinae]MBE9611032.1 hypothetical protein [Chitinilyticum piscinae]